MTKVFHHIDAKFCKSNIYTKQYSSLICRCLGRNCIETSLTVNKWSHVFAHIAQPYSTVTWTYFAWSAKHSEVWCPAPVSGGLFDMLLEDSWNSTATVGGLGQRFLELEEIQHSFWIMQVLSCAVGFTFLCWDKWFNACDCNTLKVQKPWTYCTCIFLVTLITFRCTEHANQDQG